MEQFTKDQMLNELKTILLFEADHILMGAGSKMAELFIGFSSEDEGEYCNLKPSNVDLSRFQITCSFDRGYEYAFRPSVLNTLGEHEVQDLVVFMEGTPRAGGIGSGGTTHTFMTAAGLCQTVADTVMARWKLEWEDGGSNFTTRELALLANMTEGAVRNALADKNENGLKAITGTKNPLMIEHAEAWRWLKGRRGFIPTPDRPVLDRFLTEHLQNIKTSQALGDLISRRLWPTFGNPEKAPLILGWTSDELKSWLDGTQTFDETRALSLATALDVDVPMFVGKSHEVILRRNLSSGTGGLS